MQNVSNIDSNAVALSMRNFGSMPLQLARVWTSQLATQKSQHVPLPKKAVLEIANTCNLDCPMCRVGQYGINLQRVLPLEKFKEIITQLPTLESLRLNGLGESTLVPNFDDYLDCLFERNIVVELISNGTGRLEHYRRLLAHRGVVLISFDAAEKTIFEQLRRPARWEESTQGLIDLAAVAADLGVTNHLVVLFTLQRQNISQIAKLIECCHHWGVRKVILNVVKLTHSAWIQESLAQITESLIAAQDLAQFHGISLVLPADIAGIPLNLRHAMPTSSKHCTMPWEEVVIRWDGDVQVCNMFNPYTYGNLYLNDFQTIWNNAFASLFRKYINTPERHPYCKGCVYIRNAYEP